MFGFRNRQATTPAGQRSLLYKDMAEQTHLLIAGETGSGKSVVINGILSTLMYQFPTEARLILIDPKRVELIQWKDTPHCIAYASEPGEPIEALEFALELTEWRFQQMQQHRERKYTGSHVYVVIDELADLMTTAKRDIVPLLQRLCQIGRAANVHVIAATQCPLAKIIPTEIKVNFDAILGLRTATRQHSRNIIEVNGCEALPRYGYGYYRTPTNGLSLEKILMIPDIEINRLIKHWSDQNIPTQYINWSKDYRVNTAIYNKESLLRRIYHEWEDEKANRIIDDYRDYKAQEYSKKIRQSCVYSGMYH